MMNLQQAKSMVQAELDQNIAADADDRCLIIDEQTIETDWGWVFFYQSRNYMESGDIDDMLAGNAPYIVNKRNGQIFLTGTAFDIQHYIDDYEQTLSEQSAQP